MSGQQDTELFWHSFRYLSDEMSVSEMAAFEEQLASDQAAREAVAKAVELVQTLRAIPAGLRPSLADAPSMELAPTSRRDTWMQPVGWLSLGAAACLAVVMTVQTFIGQANLAQSTVATLPLPAAPENVALAWAQHHSQSQAQSDDPSSPAESVLPEESASADGEATPAEASDSVAVQRSEDHLAAEDSSEASTPSWLLAAVAGGQSPNTTNEVRDN
jgi:anti-sigma factor RsiW